MTTEPAQLTNQDIINDCKYLDSNTTVNTGYFLRYDNYCIVRFVHESKSNEDYLAFMKRLNTKMTLDLNNIFVKSEILTINLGDTEIQASAFFTGYSINETEDGFNFEVSFRIEDLKDVNNMIKTEHNLMLDKKFKEKS